VRQFQFLDHPGHGRSQMIDLFPGNHTTKGGA
jgi:hypothetical protein